jgi:hypothetical protein
MYTLFPAARLSLTMQSLRSFYQDKIVLKPESGSFTAEGESSRWSNKDLDPVPISRKSWEWYHVGGFWVAEGFSVATMQTPSSAVALGLNPGLAIAACLVGNLMVTVPCCASGYIGSKVSVTIATVEFTIETDISCSSVVYQFSRHCERVRTSYICYLWPLTYLEYSSFGIRGAYTAMV